MARAARHRGTQLAVRIASSRRWPVNHMYALVILFLMVFALAATQRGVRTRSAYPLALGGACMLLDAVFITVLSL